MATPDLDVIKDIPGYKVILKAVVRSQIQQLVEQLAAHTDEESIILTASVADGTLSHIGSESGKSFLDDHEDVKSQFLGFCLKYHHRKKQQEKERERQEQIQQEQEKLQQMMSASQYSQAPRFMPTRSPRQYSPRYPSPRQMVPSRSPGIRHEPYPVGRPMKRPTPLNLDQQGPSAVKRTGSVDGQLIKIEPEDSDDASNHSAKDGGSENAGQGLAGSSPSQNVQSGSKSQEGSEKDDDAKSDTSAGTIPNTPAEGLGLDSDLSNLISGSGSGEQQGAGDEGTSSGSGLDPDVNVKLEALTESEMELEITGVEPGRPMPPVQMPPDSWGGAVPGMNFDPNIGGATGSPVDMGAGNQGYNGDRKFICTFCGRGFKLKHHLQNHVRIHTGEKPFVCQICNKSFTQKGTLVSHQLVHMKHDILS